MLLPVALASSFSSTFQPWTSVAPCTPQTDAATRQGQSSLRHDRL